MESTVSVGEGGVLPEAPQRNYLNMIYHIYMGISGLASGSARAERERDFRGRGERAGGAFGFGFVLLFVFVVTFSPRSRLFSSM